MKSDNLLVYPLNPPPVELRETQKPPNAAQYSNAELFSYLPGLLKFATEINEDKAKQISISRLVNQ